MLLPKANLSTKWKWGLGIAFLLLVASSLANRGGEEPVREPEFPDPLAAWESESQTPDAASAEVPSTTNVSQQPDFDPVIAQIRQNMKSGRGETTEEPATEDGDSRGQGITGAVARLSGTLLLVAAVIVALLYFARRFAFGSGSPSSSHLKVVSRAWLSSKSSVYLVRVPGKTLVVGEGPNGVNLISEIPDDVMAREMAHDEEKTPAKSTAFRGALNEAETEVQSKDLALKVRDSIAYFRDMTSRSQTRR